ncbi:hypothetical protein VPH35_075865 [Triticum aestivum]
MANNSTSSVDKPIPETSSRYLTDCVTSGYHNNFISSSRFSVSGFDWNIRIYPDGEREQDKAAYMSVFLCFCSGATMDVKVKFTLSLLGKDGKISNLNSKTTTANFKPVGDTWGWDKFIGKSRLQELLSCNDDCFTIRCVLTIIKDHHTEDVSTVLVPVPQSDLHTHLANMLKDGQGVDVTFSVGGQLFSAHRYVLAARLSVFKAELFGQMKETTMERIKIDDMEPAIFDALLHFIYTDNLPNKCDVDQNVALQHLLVATDRYGLERLKAICEGRLFATTLALAEQHHTPHLKNACLRYLCSRDVLPAVKETDGFKHLTASCPEIMMESFEKVVPPSGV